MRFSCHKQEDFHGPGSYGSCRRKFIFCAVSQQQNFLSEKVPILRVSMMEECNIFCMRTAGNNQFQNGFSILSVFSFTKRLEWYELLRLNTFYVGIFCTLCSIGETWLMHFLIKCLRYLFCFTVRKINIKRFYVIETNDIKTSQDSFNSLKHCFRRFLKYPHSEVSAL